MWLCWVNEWFFAAFPEAEQGWGVADKSLPTGHTAAIACINPLPEIANASHQH